MAESELEDILAKLRQSLKSRGAEGIRGLARHFRICDRNNNGILDQEEFERCMALNRLTLQPGQSETLVGYFDRDRSGGVSYDEFLRALRGTLSPLRRQLVMKVFSALDSLGGAKGYLTVENIKPVYSTSNHPAVKAGTMTSQEALQQFLNGFEGSEGDRDGRVTSAEWVRYYEEVSCLIDSDDYFGSMMAGTWAHLKKKSADGSRVPIVKFVPSADVARLEKKLRDNVYGRHTGEGNSKRVVEKAFKDADKDGTGTIDINEFMDTLERFGMFVSGRRQGAGGLPMEVVKALFEKYDRDASGTISYAEFAAGLFREEAPRAAPTAYSAPPQRVSRPCFPETQWLKGSNGIFADEPPAQHGRQPKTLSNWPRY